MAVILTSSDLSELDYHHFMNSTFHIYSKLEWIWEEKTFESIFQRNMNRHFSAHGMTYLKHVWECEHVM